MVDLGFNTQPPEGGCLMQAYTNLGSSAFQHTAARRRLPFSALMYAMADHVSTHSRPKAAAYHFLKLTSKLGVSTHSRPKAAALSLHP